MEDDTKECPCCHETKSADEFIDTPYDGEICKVCYVDYWLMISDEEHIRRTQ